MTNFILPSRKYLRVALCSFAVSTLLSSIPLLAEDTLITKEEFIQSLQEPMATRGMESSRPVVTMAINFRKNSAKLADNFSRRQIEEAGAALASNELSHAKFEIGGHTDNEGPDAHNMTLSYRRAKAVRNLLCKTHQVTCKQLKAKGYGETAPIASNDDDDGRSKNRRVVITRLD